MNNIVEILTSIVKILPPLILISFISYFLTKIIKVENLIDRIILIFLFNWVQIILSLQILSIFKVITSLNLYIFYGIITIICILIIILKKIKLNIKLSKVIHTIKNFFIGLELNKITKIILISWLVIIISLTFYIGIAARPPNYDSMTYHLARAGFWHQNQSISHYYTRYEHQNDYPVNSELGFLWIFMFTNSDIFAFLIQWLAFLIIIISIYKLLRNLGYSINASFITTFIFSTFDICILEASSTQNDMMVACFIVLTLYYLIKSMQNRDFKIKYFILSGITTGIVLGTKGYAYLFIPGFILFLILFNNQTKIKYKKIGYILLFSIIGFILFASYSLIQNQIHYGNFLGYPPTISEMRMGVYSFKPFWSNFLRHIFSFYQKYKGFGHLSNFTENIFNSLHNKLHIDASDPSTTWAGVYFGIFEHRINFDTSYLGLFFLFFGFPIILLNSLMFIILRIRKRLNNLTYKYKNTLLITAVAVSFLLVYCILFKWHIWAGRYMIAFAALIMINTAEFFGLLEAVKKKYLYKTILILILVLSIFSSTLPLFKNEYVSLFDRIKNRFFPNNNAQISEENTINPMLEVNKLINNTLPENAKIGLILDQSDWVYIYFGKNFQKKLFYVTDNEWNSMGTEDIMDKNNFDGLLVNSSYGGFNNGNLNSIYSKLLKDSLLTIDKSNFEKAFKPLNCCSFKITDEDILVEVNCDDPYFETNFPLNFKEYDSLIMEIHIKSKVESYLKIYFGFKGKSYSEQDTAVSEILPGKDHIYIEIPDIRNIVKLRIDPISANENVRIKDLTFYSKKNISYMTLDKYYLFFK